MQSQIPVETCGASTGKPPLAVIFGATGIGKTELLTKLYSFWQEKVHPRPRTHVSPTHSNASPSIHAVPPSVFAPKQLELIVGDSRQIYRDMHIVCAQAAASLHKKIPHHLVEELDIYSPFSLGDFHRLASQALQQIRARGNIPLLMGGAAYYLYHFCMGMPKTPPPSTALRKRLIQECQARGASAMYRELEQKDPEYAAGISSHDTQRILRALEIITQNNAPLRNHAPAQQPGETPRPMLIIGLERARESLYRRIEQRVDAMLSRGLLAELHALWERGLTEEHNAYHTIGVQEILGDARITDAWQKQQSPVDSIVASLVQDIKRNSRRYAKRQMTFFRRFKNVSWYNLDNPDAEGEICHAMLTFAQEQGLV